MRLLRILLFIISFSSFFNIIASNTEVENVINDSIITIGEITLIGNKVTKDRIILRELEFHTGSKIEALSLDSLIIKSQQNLINRSIFNFVTITKNTDNGVVDIIVNVVERWYIWPIPILQFADRNINAWLNKGDLGRVNYGVDLRVDNFRGLMERLNIILQIGYDVVVSAKWTIPYITKNQILGMELEGAVKLNHEVAYQTVNNKEVFYRSPSGYAQQNTYGNIGFTLRPEYNYVHGFQIGFSQFNFMDTILILNPDFASESSSYNYFSLNYSFKLDFRDYKPYPLKGYYFDIAVGKMGFGIFNKDVDRISLNLNFDQYFNVYRRFYFAYSAGAQISSQNKRSPYFIKSGLGYFPNNIRGYELYVVDGQQVGMMKTNLKYELLPKTKFNIKWIKSTKFSEAFLAMYSNIFFDMAYVNDIYTNEHNPLSNQVLWGVGTGLDFVTYYDLVLRLELSINKQNQTGFYISFTAPI